VTYVLLFLLFLGANKLKIIFLLLFLSYFFHFLSFRYLFPSAFLLLDDYTSLVLHIHDPSPKETANGLLAQIRAISYFTI